MDEQRKGAIVEQWKPRAGDGWAPAEGAAGHLLDALELDADALWLTLEDGRLLLLTDDSLLVASLDGSEVYADAIHVTQKGLHMRLRAGRDGLRFTLEAAAEAPPFEAIEFDLRKQDQLREKRRELAVSLAQKLGLSIAPRD